MPLEVYEVSRANLSAQLKQRRQDLLRTVPRYYRFLSMITDISASDKHEMVSIRDTLDGKLLITINKLSKSKEIGIELYNRILDPVENKEVRLYLFGGDDSISINNSHRQ